MAKPRLITRQTMADVAAARWIAQYRGDADGKAAAIRALGPTPSPDEVDRIIGNGGWTQPGRCGGCGTYPDIGVEVGDERDYDSATAFLCPKCLREAARLLRKPQP